MNTHTVGTVPGVPDDTFSVSVAAESLRSDTAESAFIAFNDIAATWDVPLYDMFKKTATEPWPYIVQLSKKRNMELIRFTGTLDGLLGIGYPAILQINSSGKGKELYVALTEVLDREFILPSGLGGKKRINRSELESVWHGTAYILWKNYKKIPSQLEVGSKTHEISILQKLLVQSGFSAGKNGEFDQKTVKALKSFQSSKGLTASGQPDSQTLLYLYRDSGYIFYHPSLK